MSITNYCIVSILALLAIEVLKNDIHIFGLGSVSGNRLAIAFHATWAWALIELNLQDDRS